MEDRNKMVISIFFSFAVCFQGQPNFEKISNLYIIVVFLFYPEMEEI